MLLFILFYWFVKKKVFKQIQIFLRIFPPFSYMVRKTNWQSISMLLSAISHFYVKRKVLYEFPPKHFKTTEWHGLAVYSSLTGEKQFLLIFNPFYWFDQKKSLNNSKISSGFAPLKQAKKNKLSEYFSARF